jgi:hypothetical protein
VKALEAFAVPFGNIFSYERMKMIFNASPLRVSVDYNPATVDMRSFTDIPLSSI